VTIRSCLLQRLFASEAAELELQIQHFDDKIIPWKKSTSLLVSNTSLADNHTTGTFLSYA
jgi:hypothetical protein